MKLKTKIYLAIFILLSILSIYELFYSEYNETREYEVKIIDKLDLHGARSNSLVLVVKLEDDTLYDTYVSPSTYSQSVIGETATLRTQYRNIKQNYLDNILTFLSILVLSMDLTVAVFLIGYGVYRLHKLIPDDL